MKYATITDLIWIYIFQFWRVELLQYRLCITVSFFITIVYTVSIYISIHLMYTPILCSHLFTLQRDDSYRWTEGQRLVMWQSTNSWHPCQWNMCGSTSGCHRRCCLTIQYVAQRHSSNAVSAEMWRQKRVHLCSSKYRLVYNMVYGIYEILWYIGYGLVVNIMFIGKTT